jgi:hypothetical protein
VLEGLAIGDLVVVAGQQKLFEGAAIKIEKTLQPPQPGAKP